MKCPLCDNKTKSLRWSIILESKEGKSIIKICEECAKVLSVIDKNVNNGKDDEENIEPV